ncbi:hypothetical protein H072_3619 [Dactylellina haptotyla CBS 200.50]|uniref:Uncharacterized protein n=1 Tax=Dactylellina haptotyla (strain CBS 200.50) TaxID=1284197 RepID=S8AHB5_DACHA|nr:hypothetical protein H072_3619 [Dactylellina haptotyla CBS 200.50]
MRLWLVIALVGQSATYALSTPPLNKRLFNVLKTLSIGPDDGATENYPYPWSGMLELGYSDYGACLKSDAADNGLIVLDECRCVTDDCRRDEKINQPIPFYRWNLLGRVYLFNLDKTQPSYFAGFIQNAGSEKCLTYRTPGEEIAPDNPEGCGKPDGGWNYRGIVSLGMRKPVFYGCNEWDNVHWNPHPWFYRAEDDMSYWFDDGFVA